MHANVGSTCLTIINICRIIAVIVVRGLLVNSTVWVILEWYHHILLWSLKRRRIGLLMIMTTTMMMVEIRNACLGFVQASRAYLRGKKYHICDRWKLQVFDFAPADANF